MAAPRPVSVVERPVSESGPVALRRRASRWLPGVAGTDDGLMGVALLAGPANVIMQLGRPEVGYGVVESRVESGRVDRHPVKRARTTFTYLAVASRGSEEQKRAFRQAVNGAHAQVFSTDDSPVAYNAFDPELQLWVAACLYKGGVDVYRTFVGEMDEQTADEHYRDGMTMGTMLQVPPEMWPADRVAFDRYWRESLEKVHIDETVRNYLYPIAVSRTKGVRLPAPVRNLSESTALLITSGFLPQRFRDEMRLDWNPEKQRSFDRLMRAIRSANNLAPPFIRAFPFNLLLHDLNWRVRTGRPLV